jgi:hypothetical protein
MATGGKDAGVEIAGVPVEGPEAMVGSGGPQFHRAVVRAAQIVAPSGAKEKQLAVPPCSAKLRRAWQVAELWSTRARWQPTSKRLPSGENEQQWTAPCICLAC